MSYILTSLSPNTESDDIKLAFYTLFTPWRWRRGDLVTRTTNELSREVGLPVVLTSSGRVAIEKVLHAFGIGPQDEVIIQAFTCISLPAAILWARATPVFADIKATTYNLDPAQVERKITSRTKAIIVQHTYGIPGPIFELKEIAKKHNLKLIEDCAHALGATVNGTPIGHFGDAAIFSFGRDKILSSIFGGAIASRDKDLIRRLQTNENQLPYPPTWWTAQQLMHPLFFTIVKALYFTAAFGKILLVIGQKLGLVSKAISGSEKNGSRPLHSQWRFSPALSLLLSGQLAKLPRYTRRRQEIATYYHKELPGLKLTFIGNASWLRFPWHVASPTLFNQRAKQHRILFGDWYSTPVFPVKGSMEKIGYILGSCPQAEAITQTIVNLPTYPTLTTRQIQMVVNFCKSIEA